MWLFILLLRLDPLLTADQISLLRELSKKLNKIRSRYATSLPISDVKIASITMILAIISDVFEQFDLRDTFI